MSLTQRATPQSGSSNTSLSELDLVTRDAARRAGAETAVIAVWARAEEVVRVLSTHGAKSRTATSGGPRPDFLGRILTSARPALSSVDPGDSSLGSPLSRAQITYAVGAPICPPGGSMAALCVGYSAHPPGDGGVILWIVESYARLAALCLDEPGVLDRMLARAGRPPRTTVAPGGAALTPARLRLLTATGDGRP